MNKLATQVNATEEFYSRDGYHVRFVDKRWRLNKDIVIPVSLLADMLPTNLYLSFRHVLAFYAKTGSASHAVNIYSRCKHYLESTITHAPFGSESLIS